MGSFTEQKVKDALGHLHENLLARALCLEDEECNEKYQKAHDAWWKVSDMQQLIMGKLLREANEEKALLGHRSGSEEVQYQISRLREDEEMPGYPKVMVLLRQGLEELADELGIERPQPSRTALISH